MHYVNIVHLSDLHLFGEGAERHNQNRIIEALEADLRQLSFGSLKPDLIIFSGDLAYAGDDGLYDQVAQVVRRIGESAELDEAAIITIPGNHDAQRSSISSRVNLISELRDRSQDVTATNTLYFDQGMVSHVSKTFKEYFSRASTFGPRPESSDSFSSTYLFHDLQVAVVAINTAILSTGGIKGLEPDEHRLVFPEIALANALASIPAGFARLVVGHHPLAFLNEISGKALENVLLKGADAYLFGHMHAADPKNIQSPIGECALVQSGALYASRKWWNGYCIVSLVVGEPHPRLQYRRWHEARQEFGVASEFDDHGVVYLSEASRSFWKGIPPRIDLQSLENWRRDVLLPSLAGECSQSLTKQPLANVYVEPEFERDAYVETAQGKELKARPEALSLQDVMHSAENFVIAATEESGKTALIRRWAQTLAETSAVKPGWRIPVILNFGQLKGYVGGVESAVKQKLARLPKEIDSDMLLADGRVTIFIDDLRLEDSQQKKALAEFIDKFPKCRYVLLTSTPFLQGAGITPVIADSAGFTTLRVKRLKNSQLLTLIEKHGTKDPKQADKLLQRMILEANALSVPITPVSGTFLIQIYTEDSSKPLVNRANLMERYIEISLEKFGSDEFLAGTFDFHNKADLLSDIAERMCREETYELPEHQFVGWISDYLTQFGLKYSQIDLLNYFVEARVLERNAGFVAFRLRAFMEYFAARRMESDAAFRDYVLAPSRYLSFPNEISFYAAISRRDKSWMEELFRRFEAHSDTVWKTSPAEVREGTLLDDFIIPSSTATEAEVLAVERRILDADLTERGRQELLTTDANDEVGYKARVYRPQMRDTGDAWIGQITLLSSMLKNMELVPNPIKTRILSFVVQGWLQFVCLSLGFVPALAKERKLTLSGVEYEVLFPEDMEIGEVARRLFLYMPISVLKVAHQYLGTEKLQLQLEEGLGEALDKQSAGQQFLRVGLLALMGAEGVADKLRSVSDRLKGKRYLSEVFLRHMYELAVRFRLPEHELREIRQLAASIATRLEGVPPKEVGKRTNEIITSLTKSRLVIGIDPDTRDDVKPLPRR
jgi:hypothetical protein